MKYYCKNCGSEYNLANTPLAKQQYCISCGFLIGEALIRVPDYETPAQYEKRMGRTYPCNGIVWWKARVQEGRDQGIWWASEFKSLPYKPEKMYVVIADPPIPPLDDFVPEGI